MLLVFWFWHVSGGSGKLVDISYESCTQFSKILTSSIVMTSSRDKYQPFILKCNSNSSGAINPLV